MSGPPSGASGGPPPGPEGGPATGRGGWSRSQWLALGGLVVLLVGVGAGLALSGGGGGGTSEAEAKGEVFLEPINSRRDPFTPSVGTDQSGVTSSTVASTTAPASGSVGIPVLSGDMVGLYGGTRSTASCDPVQLVTFLEQNPDKAAAWAVVVGIRPGEIRSFVATLTPVVLRNDTRVTNHGWVNGRANPIPAVLQAGTAVLVDRFGLPVTKCYCGNPLTAPEPLPTVVYTGPRWPGFTPGRITVIHQSTTIINIFTLVDPRTGQTFGRPSGTTGGSDTNAPAVKGPTTTPSRTVAGTYVVQYQGGVSGTCNTWPTGTGSMVVTAEPGTISITMAKPNGTQESWRGSYDSTTGAFNTPDVRFGLNPLTGTFVYSNGAFEISNGRWNSQCVSGTAQIGGFTARQQ